MVATDNSKQNQNEQLLPWERKQQQIREELIQDLLKQGKAKTAEQAEAMLHQYGI